MTNKNDILIYQTEDGKTKIDVKIENEKRLDTNE